MGTVHDTGGLLPAMDRPLDADTQPAPPSRGQMPTAKELGRAAASELGRAAASEPGEQSGRLAGVPLGARRPVHRRARRASMALALSRLEREHVALLLAICDLEGPATTSDPNAQALRDALLPMLREDLRQTQHALRLTADGRYGACEECHRPFTSRQLELKPASTRCAVCEAKSWRQVQD